MERIRDPSGEENVRYGLVFVLCKLWVENPISILYKEHRVVIKIVLYDLYILGSFSGLSIVFVIKRLSYVEFMGLWKGKEKGELEVRKARMSYCPFCVLCHDRVPLTLCRDRGFHVAIGLTGQAYDSARARAAGTRTR